MPAVDFTLTSLCAVSMMQIKEYFVELIGNTIEASVRSVRAFVKQYLVRLCSVSGSTWLFLLVCITLQKVTAGADDANRERTEKT